MNEEKFGGGDGNVGVCDDVGEENTGDDYDTGGEHFVNVTNIEETAHQSAAAENLATGGTVPSSVPKF